MCRKDEVLDIVRSKELDVVVVLGAGDLDNMVPEIAEILNNKLI